MRLLHFALVEIAEKSRTVGVVVFVSITQGATGGLVAAVVALHFVLLHKLLLPLFPRQIGRVVHSKGCLNTEIADLHYGCVGASRRHEIEFAMSASNHLIVATRFCVFQIGCVLCIRAILVQLSHRKKIRNA